MKLRQLEIQLQKIKGFDRPDASFEQYMTPATLAARMLFHANMNGDIEGARVCDLGCGTGMLAVGAALLGAEVTAVDFDSAALAVARENAEAFDIEITFIEHRIGGAAPLEITADTVVMNPPFGAQKEHADRPFIDTALAIAPTCYGIFNAGSIPFLSAYTKGRARMVEKIAASLVIPRQFAFHTKDSLEIPVEIVHLERIE
ncbi:METTL5 family protein [Methanorbis furvi]|uniref:Methyltransferase-like protein 5 n=1 Tax=Methanorbis furvi TaxID=3028299 RepID=A0AAE4S9D5_9EURY|nr:Release factor glutamine methyltransferase [Methanocorpusculaceae archaeon Ag1]